MGHLKLIDILHKKDIDFLYKKLTKYKMNKLDRKSKRFISGDYVSTHFRKILKFIVGM